MVWWSARRFEAVNFFLAREAWTSKINFQAANDSSIPKRYVNHCKRGGIGMPIKVEGCSPTPSSLLVLPSETRPPPPQHLLLTLRGGALPSPLVAHSMYTIHITIRNIHCQQKHIYDISLESASRVSDQGMWVRVCKKWFCSIKIHLACCFILILYSLTESRVSGSCVFFLCFLAQT